VIEALTQLDMNLFRAVNQGLSSPFLDLLMPVLRNKYTWIPLYVFIMGFSLLNFKWKGVWLVICLVIAVGVGDTLSSKLIKKTVKRPRPCKTEQLLENLELRIDCGSGYSFTSSHATNHFAVGVFLFFAMGSVMGRYRWLLVLWASLISVAQVYVGVHFPFDILAGGLLGSMIGFAFGKYYLIKAKQWFDSPGAAVTAQTGQQT
jgi:undecaprenyl-diphosphatase